MKKEIKKIVLIGVAGIFACAGLFGAPVDATTATTEAARTDNLATMKVKKIEIDNQSGNKVELFFTEQGKEATSQSITVGKGEKSTKYVSFLGLLAGKEIKKIQYSLDGETIKHDVIILGGVSESSADQKVKFAIKQGAKPEVLNIVITPNTSASTSEKPLANPKVNSNETKSNMVK